MRQGTRQRICRGRTVNSAKSDHDAGKSKIQKEEVVKGKKECHRGKKKSQTPSLLTLHC